MSSYTAVDRTRLYFSSFLGDISVLNGLTRNTQVDPFERAAIKSLSSVKTSSKIHEYERLMLADNVRNTVRRCFSVKGRNYGFNSFASVNNVQEKLDRSFYQKKKQIVFVVSFNSN